MASSLLPGGFTIYVDSAGYMFDAALDRADFAAAYPGYGPKHGYDQTVPIGPGSHQVCVYGIEIAGTGANQLITCRTVTSYSGSPMGALDVVSSSPGVYNVGGWTFDPDTSASTPVHIYVDGTGVAATADQPRSDIAALFPGYGANHGFNVSVPAQPGVHNVCAYGINIVAPGDNVQLGCRQVAGMSGSPVGVVDSVVVGPGGTVTASGWTYDPDTTQPIPVHMYIDTAGAAFTADKSRPDVGAVYPAYGANHGYTVSSTAGPGQHTVCLYGINIGPGSNQLLGCRVITI